MRINGEVNQANLVVSRALTNVLVLVVLVLCVGSLVGINVLVVLVLCGGSLVGINVLVCWVMP